MSLSKYKALDGTPVESAKITGFKFDHIHAVQYVIFEDGTTELHPKVHGYAPVPGDWFVRTIPQPTIHAGREFWPPIETLIVDRSRFAKYFKPCAELSETASSTNTVQIDQAIDSVRKLAQE